MLIKFQPTYTITKNIAYNVMKIHAAYKRFCADFVVQGFLEVVDPSNKGRSYQLAEKYSSVFFVKS